MAIRVGNKVIRKVYLGTKEIGMGYVGNTDVYPGVVVPSPIYGYTIQTDGLGFGSLRSINLITGETAQIGSADNFGIDANTRVIVNSIEWINGTLYGMGQQIGGSDRRQLYRLNHLDGTITSTINLSSTCLLYTSPSPRDS